ncbi:T9SS type B sorting domain-containing protein, partial [Flavobacterium sp. MK4S-17]|uniref:T9SS type B sorting domain-containing protein n=1 Tax=Flavobacterium sp. MK4S-17 TaxID=2543737 RepID=UPI00135BA06D
GGTYTITATDQNGCVTFDTFTVGMPPAPPVAPVLDTPVQPTCSTNAGSITVLSPTGTGYSYSINSSPFQGTPVFNGLQPNTYSIVVKYPDGCISQPAQAIINPAPGTPATPQAVASALQCGDINGTVTVNQPLGTDLTYSLDNGPFQASPVFNAVPPGIYPVVAKNSAGCISPVGYVTVNPAPVAPVIQATQVNPDCAGTMGSIVVTAPVGTGYMYSLDGGTPQASPVFNNLAQGTYTIVADNGIACPATRQFTLSQPSSLFVFGTIIQDATCSSPGSFTVTFPVGPEYTYSVNGGAPQTSVVFNNLPVDDYIITAVSTNGCVHQGTFRISTPAPPATPVASASVLDCEDTTGSIVVVFPTGSDITYSINGTAGPFQASPLFTGLIPDTYEVTVKNGKDCTSSRMVTINPAPASPAMPDVTTPVINCGNTTTSLTVNSPTGTGLTYSINGTAGPFQSSRLFTGITSGTYNVIARNSAGCYSPVKQVEVEPAPVVPAAPQATASVLACGDTTGTITFTNPTGSDIIYSINGTAGPFQASPVFNNVAPGTYTLIVETVQGCRSATKQIVVNPAQAAPAITATITPINCTGGSTATIEVTAPTGAGYMYSIDSGTPQASPIFTGLNAGTYTITAVNGNNCISTQSFTINPPTAAPAMPVVSAPALACGDTTGTITILSPRGSGLTYSINGEDGPFQPSPVFNNVSPNLYDVVVRNSSGCFSPVSQVTINPAPAAPLLVANKTDETCTALGSITITAPVGTGYSYSINGGTPQTSRTFNNLSAGTYTLTADNGSGCISTKEINIGAPVYPSVPQYSVTDTDCSNATGSIIITNYVVGNQYQLDSGPWQSSATFSNLMPGLYTVTVRSANGCTVSNTVQAEINTPPAPAPSPGTITGNNDVCAGETLQLVNTVTGGIWSSGNETIATVDNNGLVTALRAGTVTIGYTVGTTCTAMATKTITVYALPAPNIEDMYLCQNNDTLEVESGVLASGLSPADYIFTWSKDGSALTYTTPNIIINQPGTYTVTATNRVTGCVGEDSAVVGLSSPAIAYATVGQDFNYNQTITVHVDGASKGIYEYSLDNENWQNEPYFSNIYEGIYTVYIRDINGCSPIELEVYALNYPRFFSPNGDGVRDTWNITGLRNQKDAYIYIFDRYGKLVASIKPSGPGWDGTYNGERLPATDYWFTLMYQSPNTGAAKEFKAHFSLLR